MAMVFFDTEFYEDGRTIELISIGMVITDDSAQVVHQEIYLENAEADLERIAKASPWLAENVIPKLRRGMFMKNRAEIQWLIVNAVRPHLLGYPDQISEANRNKPDNIEFMAYYSAYDWVVLCQLFGTMMDLPSGWPMFCYDIKSAMNALQRSGVEFAPPPQPQESEHNALADAHWNRHLYLALAAAYAQAEFSDA